MASKTKERQWTPAAVGGDGGGGGSSVDVGVGGRNGAGGGGGRHRLIIVNAMIFLPISEGVFLGVNNPLLTWN